MNLSSSLINCNTCELLPKVLDNVGYLIGNNWQSFGRQLGLTFQDLEHIDADNNKTHDKVVNVLLKWKQKYVSPSWESLKNELTLFRRLDVIEEIEKQFADQILSKEIEKNVTRIPHGCIFMFDLQNDVSCTLVEFQLHHELDNWRIIKNYKNKFEYYVAKKKNKKLYVKVENLFKGEGEVISFRFSFQDYEQDIIDIVITGNCNHVLPYNCMFIVSPKLSFDNEFEKNIRNSNTLDWRKVQNIKLDKLPCDKPLEFIALDYIERNFPDSNDFIYVPPSAGDEDNLTYVMSKFYSLFAENKTGICAVLSGYCLRYHASLLKCTIGNIRSCTDENRITIFYSELNLVLIARLAHSLDCIKSETENCLNDIILFVNINKPLIENSKIIVMGVVVLPLIERKKLKEELFFHFSYRFDLDKILFLCKDELEEKNFDWWRSFVTYCDKELNAKCNNKILFKQMIGLTMIAMAKVDQRLPTLESNTQKQIKSLILNVEQINAINDKELKKIITGGYGSGKSVVGKEIVRNFIQKKENPFTLYYICCNHFSLFEYEMNKFVKYQKKESGNDKNNVICDNLYELWKKMPTNIGIKEERISIPKLLQFLVNNNINTNMNNINKVCFVLEELSPDHVKKEEAVQLNKLFSSVLKESVVVFIPESVEKYREMARSNEKHIIQKNYFNEKELGIKVFTLSKSMRVTISNKLLIDSSQDSISKSKTVCNFPNSNVYNELQRNKKTDQTPVKKNSSTDPNSNWKYESKDDKFINKLKLNSTVFDNLGGLEKVEGKSYHNDDINHKSTEKKESVIDTTDKDYHEYDLDFVSKHVANQFDDSQTNSQTIVSDCFMETSFVFKSGSIGHLIEGEKPKVIYFPFHDITEKPSVKLLSFVLEHHCFKLKTNNTVICNTMEEIKSVAYAIDIIGKYKSVTYSPHLQKYNPKLAQKKEVIKNLKTGLDILVTDCKGFSGSESESVVVLVRPGEIYLRHILVDAMSRSNSHLIVLVLDDNKVLLNNNGTIKNVLNDWSEDIFKKIKVDLFNNEDELFTKTDCLKIGEYCKDFIDRGAKKDFDAYKDDIKFQIIHENNTKIEDIANDLQANIKIKNAMDIRIKEILVKNLSSEWKIFARNSFTNSDLISIDIDNIKVDENNKAIQSDINIYLNGDENVDVKANKLKMNYLLDKLYENYPEDYQTKIRSSLKHMNKNVLKDSLSIDVDVEALKAFYVKKYGKVYEPRLNLKVTSSVDILHEFVELCLVDAGDVQTDLTHSFELMELLKKQKNYKAIQYNEVFKEENDILLITGIAGIGKSWLLKKCLLDWANNHIWKKVDFVFFFECRMLNKYQNISNIKELLDVFYKDFVSDLDIRNHNILFLIDGLDEFKYLDDLINYNSSTQYPIVQTLAELLNFKSVVAGRVYAIDRYQSVYMMPTTKNKKVMIQIMGFNDNGISYYIKNNVIEKKKKLVKSFFKSTPIAKAMASVPFYLSCMCKIIVQSKELDFPFLTMTDFYSSIFLHFLKNRITKNEVLIYKIMGNKNNKKYVWNICKIAYELFVENKVIFSKEEMQMFISDFDEVEDKLFGFIERIETDLGQIYQFAHVTMMEFCASVYAFNNFSGEEIVVNKKLRSCLSMICGLSNKNQHTLLKFLVNLNNKQNEKLSMVHVCDLLRESYVKSDLERETVNNSLFIECFYESQSSFDEIKLFADERDWSISIDEEKTSYETSCENYFVSYFIKYGRKLRSLFVRKIILSDEEKHLIMQCSNNVRNVVFFAPINIEGWKPKGCIEMLSINIRRYLISKKEYENFLPWINLCEILYIDLHDDIDFLESIIECCSNIKKLTIEYRGKSYNNLDEFKNFIK